MMNEGIKFDLFNKNKKRLEGWLLDVEGIAQGLGSETHIDTLKQLHQRTQSERFKIMVLGEFKRDYIFSYIYNYYFWWIDFLSKKVENTK